MSNFQQLFKDEISRLARKEIRQELDGIKKTVTRQRETIASLKETVAALQRELRAVQKAQGKAAAPVTIKAPQDGLRFSGEKLKTWREAHGLTLKAAGKVIGTTANSLILWESKGVQPHGASLEKIEKAMKLGKREINRMLKSQ